MVGLDQKTIEKLSRPIIKVLRGAKEKDLRRTLTVKCYTICNVDRDILLKQLKKFGDVNITDWDFITLYEIKGVDSLDLEALLGFLRKNLALN